MRLTGSKAYVRPTPAPKMPTGLVELMEDMTRDVLKNNPPDVYEFCADHMRKLLEIRDGPFLKHPLTLEEKIARAQEKVRKRGEARWQKYLKEKKKCYKQSIQPKLDNTYLDQNEENTPSLVGQPVLKSPVYPDLNIENASEIEISHESSDVIDYSEITVNEPSINHIEEEDSKINDENNERATNTAKGVSTNNIEVKDNKKIDEIDITKRDTPILPESVDKINPKTDKAKTDILILPKSVDNTHSTIDETLMIDTSASDEQCDIVNNANIKDYSDTDNIIEIKHEIKKLRNSPPIDENVIENTANVEHANSLNNKHEDLITKDAVNNLLIEKEIQETTQILEKNIDISNQDIEGQVNNSIVDVGKLVNTAVGVLHVFNETPRSQSQNAETIGNPNDETSSYSLETQDKNSEIQRDIKELSVEYSTTTDNVTTDNSVITEDVKNETEIFLQEQSEFSKKNDITDKSIIQDDYLKEKEKSDVEQPVKSNIENFLNKDRTLKDKQEPVSLERLSNDHDTAEKINVDNNQQPQNITGTISMEEHSIKPYHIKNIALDNVSAEIKMSEFGNNNLNPPSIHIHEDVNTNGEIGNTTVAIGANDYNLSNQHVNFKNNQSTSALNSPPELLGEPSVSVLNTHEAFDVLEEPNEGNIIELRISQVAEALNNEVPITITDDSLKTIEEVRLLSDPPRDVLGMNPGILSELKIEADLTEEENEDQIMSNVEDIDVTSPNITFGNGNDINNLDITNTTKTSIDESTDGMDNTSLMESGTSEVTDDTSQRQVSDNNNMDLETAAVTIQKVFRNFLFKSRNSTFDDNDENISLDEEDNEKKDVHEFQTANANVNKERRGIARMDTVLQTVNEEKSLSLSTDDSSTLSSAATTIQAHVRGFLVRNKLHSNKTASSNSLVNSEGHDDGDVEHKNKTILNIHIVPEGGNYLSRDESMLTSMDLSLDGSPPSSLNLHPLGYDKNERRKQLKREDAIQSISPPSNNSGKLSEDVDSVKDMLIIEEPQNDKNEFITKNDNTHVRPGTGDTSPTNSLTIETVIESNKLVDQESSDGETDTPVKNGKFLLTKQNSDEMDVVTPFEDKNSLADTESTTKLMHSGEFHDIVLPTKVLRNDASVVREFKNVLVYFLLWNNS